MIVDTSAIVAILTSEPERERFLEAITAAPRCSVAAPTLLETFIVLGKFGSQVTDLLTDFIHEAGLSVVPFDEIHAAAAQDAHRRFGKGSGHAAGINFGDCFSYAACAVSGEPLLFKGNDFARTDIVNAVAP